MAVLRRIFFCSAAALVLVASAIQTVARSGDGLLRSGSDAFARSDRQKHSAATSVRDLRARSSGRNSAVARSHADAHLVAQYITVLKRPAPRIAPESLSEGLSMASEGYSRVSSSQLQALRKLRQAKEGKQEKTPEAVQKTVLTSLDATEYVGPIGIGTTHHPKGCNSLVQQVSDASNDVATLCQSKEQQTLKVVFDTGSTNLWMASTLCTSGPCVSNDRQRYDLFSSETYTEPISPRTLTINFATATLKGPMGIDQFHIGPFTVENQSFGLIQEERGTTFQELPLEGIVGLAFPSMSAGGVKPFFDNVIDQQLLKRNMFAFYLSPTDSHGSASLFEDRYAEYKPGMDAILWGGVDTSLYEGELVWFPVTQAHYWSIDLHGFFIGNQSMGFDHHKVDDDSDFQWGASLLDSVGIDGAAPAKLIVDSGTTYYTAEDAYFNSIMDRLGCDENGSAPVISYRLKDVDGKMRSLILKPEDYMVSKCEPGFLKIAVPKGYGPAMLLGELFMRRFFTVFDRGDGSNTGARIGLAKARPGAEIGAAVVTD